MNGLLWGLRWGQLPERFSDRKRYFTDLGEKFQDVRGKFLSGGRGNGL